MKAPHSILPLVTVLSLTAFLIMLGLYLSSRRREPKDTSAKVLSALSRVMLLPEEHPQIRLVSDTKPLTVEEQELLKNAAPHHAVITYPGVRLLFDPKARKILAIQAVPTPSVEPPGIPITIALRYNGDEEARAKLLKNQFAQVSPNYVVVEVAKSPVVYPGDVVYLVNPKRHRDADALARALGGSALLESPAAGEPATEADVIVSFRDIP